MLWGIRSRDLGCSPRGVWGIGEVREKNQRDILSFHLIGWVAVLGKATLLASQPMFSPLRPHHLVKPPWRSLLQRPLTLPCLWGLTVPEASGDSGLGWRRGRSTLGGMRPSPDILCCAGLRRWPGSSGESRRGCFSGVCIDSSHSFPLFPGEKHDWDGDVIWGQV